MLHLHLHASDVCEVEPFLDGPFPKIMLAQQRDCDIVEGALYSNLKVVGSSHVTNQK